MNNYSDGVPVWLTKDLVSQIDPKPIEYIITQPGHYLVVKIDGEIENVIVTDEPIMIDVHSCISVRRVSD